MRIDHDEHDLETVYLTHMGAAQDGGLAAVLRVRRKWAELPELSFG